MVKRNSQKYRIRSIDGEQVCLPRSNDEKKEDFYRNKRYCKKDQDFSPTTSLNTGLNSYKKKERGDPKGNKLKEKKSNTTKKVIFRSPSPKKKGGKTLKNRKQ